MRKVMLSTAEPAEEPRYLRRRLDPPPNRRRPQILVLDTGLHTVVEKDGTCSPPSTTSLDCCVIDEATWRT